MQLIFVVNMHGLFLKDKRGICIVNAFEKMISKGCKSNKIWVDQGREFYDKLLKRFLKINDIEMYLAYNERKSVFTERFIRKLKNKIFKQMAAISTDIYFDVLDNIVNKYNNTAHRTIKIKPTRVTSDSYAESNEDSNVTKLKFKVGDNARVSKYKKFFALGYTQNWSEEVFIITKIKDIVSWTYVISDLNGEKIAGSFYEKEFQKTSQEKFRTEKVLEIKGDKLYVKWKGYDNSFNSWINEKDLV